MQQLYRTPFSRAYWKTAARELGNVRMWVLAALLTAIRIALKSIRLPIAENLYIGIGFLPNALGSMIYGPVLAIFSAIVSDTLGALLFPAGPYFPPFALVEILGSVLFALFLYRAPLRVWRVAFSKLMVNIVCNILLTPIMLGWMQGSAAQLLALPRIIKNVLLFPAEAVLLVLLLDAMIVPLKQMRVIPAEQARLTLTRKHFVMLGALLVIAALCVLAYYQYELRR